MYANLVGKVFFKKVIWIAVISYAFAFTTENIGVLNSTSVFSHCKTGTFKVGCCLRFWKIYYKAEHFTLQ